MEYDRLKIPTVTAILPMNLLSHTKPRCAVLFCAVLFYPARAVLCHDMPCCTVPCCAVLSCAVYGSDDGRQAQDRLDIACVTIEAADQMRWLCDQMGRTQRVSASGPCHRH